MWVYTKDSTVNISYLYVEFASIFYYSYFFFFFFFFSFFFCYCCIFYFFCCCCFFYSYFFFFFDDFEKVISKWSGVTAPNHYNCRNIGLWKLCIQSGAEVLWHSIFNNRKVVSRNFSITLYILILLLFHYMGIKQPGAWSWPLTSFYS